jgi:hypothetical protein
VIFGWLNKGIRIVHDVERESNLDALWHETNGSLDKLSREVGDGLHAIALALSTREDNSAQILELAGKVKTVREKLKQAVDRHTKGD